MFQNAGYHHFTQEDLETKLSTEEGTCWLDFMINDELSEEACVRLERIQNILHLIPPIEADFVELYYYKRVKQTDIASLFCCSQPTVCYRLQRASDRIQFLLSIPEISKEEIQTSMSEFLTKDIDVKIMVEMFETTCQSEVAKRLSVSQGLVRHRFVNAVLKMRDAKMYDEGYRFRVYMRKDRDHHYRYTFSEAKNLLEDAKAYIEANPDPKDSKDPKIVSVPPLDPTVGKYYDVYAAISDNLTILKDVRRKGPDNEIAFVLR